MLEHHFLVPPELEDLPITRNILRGVITKPADIEDKDTGIVPEDDKASERQARPSSVARSTTPSRPPPPPPPKRLKDGTGVRGDRVRGPSKERVLSQKVEGLRLIVLIMRRKLFSYMYSNLLDVRSVCRHYRGTKQSQSPRPQRAGGTAPTTKTVTKMSTITSRTTTRTKASGSQIGLRMT